MPAITLHRWHKAHVEIDFRTFDFTLLIDHNGHVVKLRSFIAVFLIVGFLISLHGRVEAETISHSHGSESEMSDQKDGNDTAPAAENHPLGAHKDQHGCYHSHASLNLPPTMCPLSPIYGSTYVMETNFSLFSTIPSSIAPPPRV